ncbi:response regulator [Ohtaekwangia koreensis]|uniref:CheY chemotaxis protein or a CheY-like REC (Receiver) domain n=1 Tax=Ohtaekwangia koreensis TaxID=688867 RepID=A0A1T5K3W1_9BACT|nr:response regulator [Ohtaekwangia koreensis]SKC58158.1 CheY chemotaxis protein or a CheY-like REC (receiver) domain [Ohtaekwangia koreensis]
MNQKQLIQNIYYADDDQDDVLLFKDVFVELGQPINLTIAENGIVLLEKLLATRQHPDVIFMDLNMPLKNGFQCLKEIKTHTSLQEIPVVILSTSSAMDNIEKSYQLGAFQYIQKPMRFSLLKTEIEKCLVKVIGRYQN